MSASRSINLAALVAAVSVLSACGGGGGGTGSTTSASNSSTAASSNRATSNTASSSTSTSASSNSNYSSSASASLTSSSSASSGSLSFIDQQVGYSTQNGGTTGGTGGTVVTVTTGTELNTALCNRASKTTPIIIMVNGTINHSNTTKQSGQCDTAADVIELKGIQNISIIGVDSNAVFDQIGIHIRDAKNIIIRNVHVKNVKKSGSPTSNGGDAIGMESTVSNVWVDHVTLEASGGESAGYDALFDMKDGTKYVTLSWSILKNSGRGGLVGSGDTDCDNGPVSFHHNYYQNIDSRTPLLRCATAHAFNNYYDGLNESGMNPRIGGKMKAENNYFTNAKNPLGTFYTNDMGYWDVSGNIFGSGVTWSPDATEMHPAGPNVVSTTSISIPYVYALDIVDQVPEIVKNGSGAGKMPSSSSSSSASSGSGSSAGSGSSSSTSSSASSSSSNSSASSSSSVATAVCTAAFTCDSGVGAGHMSSTVTAVGSDSVSAGVYTIDGAGVMGSGTSYNHYFKYMPLTGDFTITARITTQGGSSANARAGLLAAEGISGTYKFAWAARYSSTGEIRAATNGNNGSAISGFTNATTNSLPVWVRITRVGNNLTTEASTDGTTFVNRGAATMTSTQSTLYVGFAVSSNSNTATVQAVFDNLQIVGGGL